jgi:hypothetical protein
MKRLPPLPVIPALDLWSLGHSASQVSEMLGMPRKEVTKIVGRARSIGDKRAVLHVASSGRLIGRPGRMQIPPVAIPVPALPQKRAAQCARGHERTPESVNGSRQCRECERLRSIRRKGHR